MKSICPKLLHPFSDLRRLDDDMFRQLFQLLASGRFYLQIAFFCLGEKFPVGGGFADASRIILSRSEEIPAGRRGAAENI